MILAPNAYWLNFFLKRDINVICWNYRGYGDSEKGLFDFANPTKAKRDAEHVLAHSIDILNLQGKIGAFGRSIGGIAACHLAGKYSDLVELLVIDRSLDELLSIAVQKLRGSVTTTLYNQMTRGWRCENATNYVKADQCYKIITCDPLDDTVG
jgi:pimeloyl-ACP methyl ester carboxylesterase